MSKYEWDLGEIKIAVKESINFTEVLDKIGAVSYTHLTLPTNSRV